METEVRDVERVNIHLKNVMDANELSKMASQARFDVEVRSLNGRYVVDAKSLMGLFSLDLTKDVELVMFSNDESQIGEFKSRIKQFIVS